MISPVFLRNTSVSPFSFRESQYSEVLRHCQTIARYTGSPVWRSQTIAVSLWLVIPMAAISSADAPIFDIASTATPSWVDQISLASCSTQPGFGKYWVNSFCATLHISPFSLNRIQRLLVVPASSAITYFAILSSQNHFKRKRANEPKRRAPPGKLALFSCFVYLWSAYHSFVYIVP